MKFLTLFLACTLIQWQPDFEIAKKQAADQHKLILLNFSGSDWCAPCILMRKEYLESDVFTNLANERLILVNADFPQKSKNALPPDVAKRNGALAEKYNPRGNFPLTLLLDSNGKVLKTWNGKPEMPVEKWVEQVKSVSDANR